ncbi:MAG: GC-type dockerin domain-anchored protein [Phycisphaerales bacterium]
MAATAAAQVTPIGPFSGPHRESFETQPAVPNQLYECLPGGVFAGAGSICEPEGDSLIVTQFTSLFCIATPRTGNRFVFGLEAPVEVTFNAPARRFGGYFATHGGDDGGSVVFSDGATVVGTVALTTNQCTYVWNGWESTTPFTRVRIIGESAFSEGGYVFMDDLEFAAAGAGCYPNCDGSTQAPVLNVQDFGCFLARYAAGEAYANCDGSTQPPVLNVQDFGCFLSRYAAGCP